jgi:hypothetical protein
MRSQGYLCLHTCAVPRSREHIDHLVIGPTGVYAALKALRAGEVLSAAGGTLITVRAALAIYGLKLPRTPSSPRTSMCSPDRLCEIISSGTHR